MFPMTKFYDLATHYDLATRDIANSFKSLDEINQKNDLEKGVRCKATDNDLELSIDIPGVRTEDLKIRAVGRELIIDGKLRDKSFSKKYSISKNFDIASAKATHEYGVLNIHFSRTSDSKPPVIEIKVS